MSVTHFDAVDKVWSGPNRDINVDKHENLGAYLLANLESDPERVAQINGDTGESLTKRELRIRSIRCAQHLIKLGCTQNDRISIIARNHHNLTPLLYGALCIGTTISPLDVMIVKDGIDVILERIRPSLIFCDADIFDEVKNTINVIGFSAKFFTVDGSIDGYDSIDSLMKETGDEDTFVCSKIDDAFSHIAVIGSSSGSTGFPKSVCVTHALLIYRLKEAVFCSGLTALNFISMHWMMGVLVMLSSAFDVTRVFTSQPFSPDIFFDFVEKFKVQIFVGMPRLMQAISNSERCESADLSSLLTCFLSGNHLPTILVQKLKRIIPKCVILSAYGSTEMHFISSTTPNELDEYPNCSGRLFSGLKVKIIDQKTNENCGVGEVGEIYIKLPIPSMGYYKDETTTRNTYDSSMEYFITGDLGYFDGTGRLYLVGRKKEIFRTVGADVWPGELESIVLKHSAVQEVCVVGVYDDELITDLPAAVVVKRKDSSVTANDIFAIVADHLPSYKCLHGGIYFVDKLPMTSTGKVIRSKAKEIAQNIYQQLKLSQKQ